MIDNQLIDYLEKLSRLKLSPQEKETVKKNLGDILNYMDILKEIDTAGVEPFSHPFSFTNNFREDETRESYGRQEILVNAPSQKNGSFKVPKTIE